MTLFTKELLKPGSKYNIHNHLLEILTTNSGRDNIFTGSRCAI